MPFSDNDDFQPLEQPEVIGGGPEPAVESKPEKTRKTRQPRKAAPQGKLSTDGPVYLILSANGKYRELSESELAVEGATVIKDPTLRLVKGKFLMPQIGFAEAESAD